MLCIYTTGRSTPCVITAGQGLGPQYSPSKGDVLPLDEPANYSPIPITYNQ